MLRRSRLFLGIVVLGLIPLSAETNHLVQKGDTVYGIARKFGVSVESILKANNIEDPQKIAVGKLLIIPGAAVSTAASISAAAANPPATANPVVPPSAAVTAAISHRVLRGETLFGLARQYNLSVDELRTANGFSAADVLKEGTVLTIPGRAPSVSAGSAPKSGAPASPGGTISAEAAAARGEVRPVAAKTADTALRWPIAAKEVSYLEGKLYGVWILGERSETVIALRAGTVAAAGHFRGFGQVAIVRTKDGLAYVYGGCESLSVAEGDTVAGGTALGKLGLDQLTGDSRLFFFVYDDNIAVDPASAPRDL